MELNKQFFGKKKVHYHVDTRYTCGSPAVVPEQTALRVAEEEKKAYERALTGVYGDDKKTLAETKGLDGIVEARAESGSGKKFTWMIQDLITGTCRHRQPKE